jgi:hypothetical protein
MLVRTGKLRVLKTDRGCEAPCITFMLTYQRATLRKQQHTFVDRSGMVCRHGFSLHFDHSACALLTPDVTPAPSFYLHMTINLHSHYANTRIERVSEVWTALSRVIPSRDAPSMFWPKQLYVLDLFLHSSPVAARSEHCCISFCRSLVANVLKRYSSTLFPYE